MLENIVMATTRTRLLPAWCLCLSLAASAAWATISPEYDMTVTVGVGQASLEVSGQLVIPPSTEPRGAVVPVSPRTAHGSSEMGIPKSGFSRLPRTHR